jgi:hypothetical protein
MGWEDYWLEEQVYLINCNSVRGHRQLIHNSGANKHLLELTGPRSSPKECTRVGVMTGLQGAWPALLYSLPIQMKYWNIDHLFDWDACRQKDESISDKASEPLKQRPSVSVRVDRVGYLMLSGQKEPGMLYFFWPDSVRYMSYIQTSKTDGSSFAR